MHNAFGKDASEMNMDISSYLQSNGIYNTLQGTAAFNGYNTASTTTGYTANITEASSTQNIPFNAILNPTYSMTETPIFCINMSDTNSFDSPTSIQAQTPTPPFDPTPNPTNDPISDPTDNPTPMSLRYSDEESVEKY